MMHDESAQSAPSDSISDGSDHRWLPGLALSLSLSLSRALCVCRCASFPVVAKQRIRHRGRLIREGKIRPRRCVFRFQTRVCSFCKVKKKNAIKTKSSSRLFLFFLWRGLQFESLIIIDCCSGGEYLWLACKSLHCHSRCYPHCQRMLQFLRLECWTDYPRCQTLRLLCLGSKTWQSRFALPCYGGSDACSNSDK